MYKQREESLMAYTPGQIVGQTDDGTISIRQYHGWVLIFGYDFISVKRVVLLNFLLSTDMRIAFAIVQTG